MKGSIYCGVAAMLAAATFARPAAAQALDDHFWLQVSGYWPHIDTDVRISPAANPNAGTEIDLERDLGLDDSEFQPSVYAGARLGGGFSLSAEYYSLSRDSSTTLARDIVVEDVTYPTAGTLTAGFKTDIYRATLGWAFVRNPGLEIGANLGLHATNLELSLEGQGSVGGAPVSVQQRRQDFLAPLPTIGLFATVQVVPRVTLSARFDWLSLSIGDYDGRLLNAQAGVAYRFTRNFGIGVMYRYVDYRVDVEKERYTGRFAYSFSGPAVYLEAGF